MNRIKVVSDATDLVPVLRAVDSPLKVELLKRLSDDWMTEKQIADAFGKEGVEQLAFFEHLNLIDTRWQSGSSAQPEKSYHSYYSTVSVNASAPISEFYEILSIATMKSGDYADEEKRIIAAVGNEGSRFFSDVAQELGMSPTRLKGLVKRSEKLDYHGHRIEITKKNGKEKH